MKALNVKEGHYQNEKNSEDWNWVADKVDTRIEWSMLSSRLTSRRSIITNPKQTRHWTALRAVWQSRKSDLLVTHGTLMAVWVGVFKRLLGINTTHLAWSFTMPNYDDYSFKRKALFRFGLRDVDRFVMYSSVETKNYPAYLKLPPERFKMIPWSVERPDFDTSVQPIIEGEYISAIGGEGRDYRTLFEAARSIPDIKMVVVASPQSIAGLDVPENVELFVNIPYEDAMNIAYHSKFMVLPLISDQIPCGHGSLIAQFYMGKATIVTDSAAMEGYSYPEENVLTYPAKADKALRNAIVRLSDNESLRHTLSLNAHKFALENCTEDFTVNYFNKYIYEKGFLNQKQRKPEVSGDPEQSQEVLFNGFS